MKAQHLILCLLMANYARAQLQVNGLLHIQAGAFISIVDMDLNASINITGSGELIMQGSASSNINTNANTIPRLNINKNTGNVSINGNTHIGELLHFANGNAIVHNDNLYLDSNAIITNANSSNHIKTLGAGNVLKQTNLALTNYQLPIGTATYFAPLIFTNTCACTNTVFGGRAIEGIHPNKLPSATDYINIYWPVFRSGTMASLNVNGTYDDPANIIGSENNFTGAMYNGSAWLSTGSSKDIALNNVGVTVNDNGELFAQNSFVLVNAKAFLMGPYTAAINKMTDGLRAGTNLIPLTDPYRSAPYSASFVHFNNPTTETANAAVFTNTDVNNAIVDWVFLELRNTTSGNAGANKVKTRSALIQRDGDIVDVDGISPVLFKDVPPGNYALAVRHRNHLGLCTDPAPVNMFALSSDVTSNPIIDFTTLTDAQLFGKADSNYFINKTSFKNVLWAGNASTNTRVSFSGGGNDKDKILSTLTNNPLNTTVTNVYHESDVNMNRNVRFTGGGNDKDFILNNALNSTISTIRNQTLPQ